MSKQIGMVAAGGLLLPAANQSEGTSLPPSRRTRLRMRSVAFDFAAALSVVRRNITALVSSIATSYRPEKHYMRGFGPKSHEAMRGRK